MRYLIPLDIWKLVFVWVKLLYAYGKVEVDGCHANIRMWFVESEKSMPTKRHWTTLDRCNEPAQSYYCINYTTTFLTFLHCPYLFFSFITPNSPLSSSLLYNTKSNSQFLPLMLSLTKLFFVNGDYDYSSF